jgi:hypothetical protein
MYVCIDQNCGVTTEEGGEEEEANISLLFSTLYDKRERKPVYGQIFSFFDDEKREKEEREREQGESDIVSIRGVYTLFRKRKLLIGFLEIKNLVFL